MAKSVLETKSKFVPWHGVLYTNISTQVGHGFLSLLNANIYHLKHGNDYNEMIAIQNYGLQPYARLTSMASTSAINFGTPFFY